MAKAQAGKTEIQTVTVDRVVNTSDVFAVYRARTEDGRLLTVKQFLGPVRSLQRWCVAGAVVDDPRWGKQYVAQFAALAAPRDIRELESFLTSGHVPGWDSWAFNKLTRAFDSTSLDALYQSCKDHPSDLLEIEGITPEMLQNMRDAWTRGEGLAPIYSQLAEWGCSGRQSEALIKHYGFSAVAKLAENPYRDLQEIRGYGWLTAESIARSLGIEQDDPQRVIAGVEYAIYERTWQSGSTWLYQSEAVGAAAALLGLPSSTISARVDTAVAQTRLIRDGVRLYPESLYSAEQMIAAQVAQRQQFPGRVAVLNFDDTLCSPDQQNAVAMAMDHRLSLLTGGPGTGKTTALKELIMQAQANGLSVTCMAPTGKAAARMSQATGYPASTIHSRLKIVPGKIGTADDMEPVTGMVIVDEVSMLDTSLAAQMLSRISPAAQILLIGDPDQLPSVGPGAVLRDLIDANTLPRVHLEHVYRNEAGIATNAARMRSGQDILSLPDCELVPAESKQQALELLQDALECARTGGTAPQDILVLTPTNDGLTGRLALNQRLQEALSPSLPGTGIRQYAGTSSDPDGTIHKWQEELRVGDRVMVVRNDSQLGVFNGQVGRVLNAQIPRSLDVEIDGEVITFTGETKRLLTLAYAITGHKAQGSEAPVVIAPIFGSRVLSREWLYTVITRAKRRCTLIGDVAAMQACIGIRRTYDRKTGLVEALLRTQTAPDGGAR